MCRTFSPRPLCVVVRGLLIRTCAPPPTKSELRRFQAKEDLIKISKLLRRELERFDYVKVQEFSALCISYIESVMTMEHQICKAWEAFLPEAKALQV